MKKALYYAVRRDSYGFEVVTVTSVKGSHWNGRDKHGNASHGVFHGIMSRGLYGKFDTLEEAEQIVKKLLEVVAKHKPFLKAASQAYANVRKAERDELDIVCKGIG